jgi:hypothetical protein
MKEAAFVLVLLSHQHLHKHQILRQRLQSIGSEAP